VLLASEGINRRTCSAFDEALQLLRTAWVTQLAERLSFDLADALTSDFEILTYLFKGVVALLADAEAHSKDLLLAGSQCL